MRPADLLREKVRGSCLPSISTTGLATLILLNAMAGLEGGYGGGGAGEPSGAVGLVFVLERKMTEWAGGSMEGLNGGTEWGRRADVERFFFLVLAIKIGVPECKENSRFKNSGVFTFEDQILWRSRSKTCSSTQRIYLYSERGYY